MRYAFDVTVPFNTLADTPHSDELELTVGVLTRCLIRFRHGCHNRVYVTVSDGLFQIVPASPDAYLYANDYIFDIPMNYPLTSRPFALTVTAWSPGTFYDHVITLWFDLLEPIEQARSSFLSALVHLGGLEA